MININFDINALKEQITKLPEGCVLEISKETQIFLQLVFHGLQKWDLSTDLDMGELFGRRVKSYSGNNNMGLHINPVMPLKTIKLDTEFNKIIKSPGALIMLAGEELQKEEATT